VFIAPCVSETPARIQARVLESDRISSFNFSIYKEEHKELELEKLGTPEVSKEPEKSEN
jgi:hypothetical protein